jgi:hypothetical protein
MQAYFYDNDRFYAHSAPCQRDPLESEKQGKDIYLTPANSTNIQPEIVDGAKPRWTGEAWEQYPDDKVVYGYTPNDDGTINYYGSNHIAEELQRIHSDVVLSFSDTEPVSVNGIYWLSADNPAYIEAKAEADKEQALDDLDAQYNADKDELLKAYQTAVVYGDTDLMASLKADLEALDEQYDADYEELIGEE